MIISAGEDDLEESKKKEEEKEKEASHDVPDMVLTGECQMSRVGLFV